MNIPTILKAYDDVGVSRYACDDEVQKRDLYTARALAQAAIRKAGCSVVIKDDGVWITLRDDDFYVHENDIDVAYQSALRKISEGGR